MSQHAKFLYEVGMLQRTPRSGFAFLGSGKQSVAEHTYRMLNMDNWWFAVKQDAHWIHRGRETK